MKLFIHVFLSILLFTPLAVSADMIPEGMRDIESSAVIDNVTDYAAYDLYLGGGPVQKMISNTVPETYFGDGHAEYVDARLFAVKKTDAKKLKPGDPCDGSGCYDNWYELPANKPFIIPSDFHVKIDHFVADASPIMKERFVIHIDGISATSVRAHLVKAVALDKNGQEINAVQNAGVPPIQPIFYFIGGMIVAAGLIGIGTAFQKWKK